MNDPVSLTLKIVKFGFVGVTGLCIDFGITWLLKEKVKANKYVANSCGFLIAAVNNYILNRLWTFQSTKEWAPQLGRFMLIAAIGLLMSNLLIKLLLKKRIPFYYAKAIAVICIFIWNFSCNYFFNF